MAKRGRGALFKQRAADVVTQAVAVTPSLERQQWLEHPVEALRTRFADVGYTIPQKIRVSIRTLLATAVTVEKEDAAAAA